MRSWFYYRDEGENIEPARVSYVLPRWKDRSFGRHALEGATPRCAARQGDAGFAPELRRWHRIGTPLALRSTIACLLAVTNSSRHHLVSDELRRCCWLGFVWLTRTGRRAVAVSTSCKGGNTSDPHCEDVGNGVRQFGQARSWLKREPDSWIARGHLKCLLTRSLVGNAARNEAMRGISVSENS